jgi:hypothetical protein
MSNLTGRGDFHHKGGVYLAYFENPTLETSKLIPHQSRMGHKETPQENSKKKNRGEKLRLFYELESMDSNRPVSPNSAHSHRTHAAISEVQILA